MRGKKACTTYWVLQRRPWKITNSREFRYPIRHCYCLMPKEHATFFARRDTIQAILSLRKMVPFKKRNLPPLSKDSYRSHEQSLTQNEPTLSCDQGSLSHFILPRLLQLISWFWNSSRTSKIPLPTSSSSSSSKSPLAYAITTGGQYRIWQDRTHSMGYF